MKIELYFVIFSEKFKKTSYGYKSKTEIPVGYPLKKRNDTGFVNWLLAIIPKIAK